MITDKICNLIVGGEYEVHLLVENTQLLLDKLNHGALDIAMIEGNFDKCNFGWKQMHTEPFVGICNKESPLANREVSFEEAIRYPLLLREEGSGTRDILQQQLQNHGKSIEDFSFHACISSFPVMKDIIAANLGITFAYESVMKNDPRLAKFQIRNFASFHDLYYVYLENTYAESFLNKLMNQE